MPLNYIIFPATLGLFCQQTHYVVISGAGSSFLSVLDPYLYPGKFDKPGRRGKVTLNGVTAYVSPEELDRDTKRYYIFEKTEERA